MKGWTERLGTAPLPLMLVMLALAGAVAFLPGQAALPLVTAEEARAVETSRQMLQTGDLLAGRSRDTVRLGVLPGLHWVQALAALPFGGSEAPLWAFRLPGLVAAAAALALTGWALAPLLGSAAAVLAAAILGASVLLQVEARLAQGDALALATLVLAQGALARLWLAQGGRGMAAVFWGAVIASLLLAGPATLLPPLGAAAALWLAGQGLPARAQLRPGLGAGLLAAVLVLWLGAVTLVTGAAPRQGLVLADLLAGGAGVKAPPGTQLSLLLVTFWPFAILAPWAAVLLWPRRSEVPVAFLLGWLVPAWLVAELVPLKLPRDALLLSPAIAALIALAFAGLSARPQPDGFTRGAMVAGFGLPALGLALAAPLAPLLVGGGISVGAAVVAVAAALLLGFGGVALWRWRLEAFAGLAILGSVLGGVGALQFGVPAAEAAFIAPRLAEAEARWRCGEAGFVVLTGYRRAQAAVALGPDTVLADGRTAAQLLLDGRAALAFVADDDMMDFAAFIGLGATALDRVDGVDFLTRRPVNLTLYARDRDPDALCP